MNLNEAKQALQKLVERYDKYKEDKSFLSNEKQICESLILPFFRNVLKWDTEDPSEFRLEEQRAGQRPDYLVKHQGMTQFIVEAKAATKDLFEDETALKQALEYGYNADKDFVVLTNFKQFIVLAPKIQYRNPLEAAIVKTNLLNINDTDLQTILGFEKEYWLTSGKNNILYSKLLHHKKSVPVDDRLLDDMKKWREMLLTNIQKQNHKLNFDDEQDFAEIEKEVQKFIDRLVFICCCEDKGIHHEPTLKRMLNDKNGHYAMNPGWLLGETQKLFTKYRKVPDSDLFDLSLADKFVIEDSKLIELFTDLREPKGRPAYNFDEIDEDILGKVYENFIGHVQTGKKRFKEKEDLGKRKKEGIYYTPKYIVEYIVNNTVREYIKGKTFEEILKVKILDPACGSGSFLLRAFNVLVEESAKILKRPLTYGEKKKLLLNCIFGVDLDERAVEITKLTFSLKLAQISEGLPVLGDNIRHGNSLIDDEDIAGYTAFKWEEEFKEIMKNGGFDVVIGNPPYIFSRSNKFTESEKQYFYNKYKLQNYQINTYSIFVEQAYSVLRNKGYFGFIIPNNWLTIDTFEKFRKFIFENTSKTQVINIYDKVFQEANVDTCILIFGKSIPPTKIELGELSEGKFNYIGSFITSDFTKNKFVINISSLKNKDTSNIMNKIENESVSLINIAKVSTGLKAYQKGKGKPPQTEKIKELRSFHSKEKQSAEYLPYLEGRDVRRYQIVWSGEYLKYGDFLAEPRKSVPFNGPRILIRQIPSKPPYCINAAFTDKQLLHDINSMVIFNPSNNWNIKYVLALLNSKLMSFWFLNKFGKLQRKTFPQFKVNELSIFPFRDTTESSKNRLINLVDEIEQMYEEFLKKDDKNIEKKINNLNEVIDNIVYKIYNINEDEKNKIVEILNNYTM